MPNILFASNNISHWPSAVLGVVGGTFDSDRVPYTLAMQDLETLTSPDFVPSTNGDTWFHFRMYAEDISNTGQAVFFQAFQPDGTELFMINKKFTTTDLRLDVNLYDGNTTNSQVTTIRMALARVNSIDFHYNVQAGSITLKVYINSGLAATLTFGTNPNNFVDPVRFAFGTAFTVGVSVQHMSEILVADGDTRNARLDLLRPLAAGNYSEWVGLLPTLSDNDPVTGMTTLVANKRETVTLSAYTGAANISNFCVVSQTTRGQNAPTKLKHTVRLSNVDYDGADITISDGLKYSLTDYLINPGTSLPWVGSELAAMEAGFVSVA